MGSLLKVLLRRWLVLLLGAVLTLGVAAYVYSQTPSRYQSTARMLLLLPSDSRGPDVVGSPFLYLPNGLSVLARIVALTPTSRDFQAQMVQDGYLSQYEVGVDNSSPTLTISVEGSDPQNVVETRDRLIEAINQELLTIQREEGAPQNQIAHTRVYAAESTPEQIGGDRLRGVLAAGGAGLLLTLILVFAIDRLIQVRQVRRGQREDGKVARKRKNARRSAAEQVDETSAAAASEGSPAEEELASGIHDAVYDEAAEEAAQDVTATAEDEPAGPDEGETAAEEEAADPVEDDTAEADKAALGETARRR